jgi:hypothetical protein
MSTGVVVLLVIAVGVLGLITFNWLNDSLWQRANERLQSRRGDVARDRLDRLLREERIEDEPSD